MMTRPVEDMSRDERADELQHWFDIVLTVEFSKLHKRIEQLVGRPVWTHEISTAGTRWLLEEARTGRHPENLAAHVVGSLDQMAGTRPVVIARVDGSAND